MERRPPHPDPALGPPRGHQMIVKPDIVSSVRQGMKRHNQQQPGEGRFAWLAGPSSGKRRQEPADALKQAAAGAAHWPAPTARSLCFLTEPGTAPAQDSSPPTPTTTAINKTPYSSPGASLTGTFCQLTLACDKTTKTYPAHPLCAENQLCHPQWASVPG